MIAILYGGKTSFEIGLTDQDMEHLRNGGKVVVNPKDVGLVDMEISVYFGGTHEKMEEQIKKRPDFENCRFRAVDSHR